MTTGSNLQLSLGHPRDPGVAEVGRQCQHALVNIYTFLVPKHQSAYCKGVAQVMDARCAMAATINPAELLAKLLKDAMDLPIANGLPE